MSVAENPRVPPANSALRVANAAFGALFVFSTAVQFNDPDPVRWVLVYAGAAAACLGWERGWLPRGAFVGLAGIAGLWAVASALDTHLDVPVGTALSDWKMHAGGSEELRETLGLVLVVGWMLALAFARPRSRGPGPVGPG